MRYLDLATPKRYSVIGLGTWQFGPREWGYGSDYADHAAGAIVARYDKQRLLPLAEYFPFASIALLRREFARVREFTPGGAAALLPTKVFPVRRPRRSSSSAAWPAPTARRAHDRPLPGPPAQPDCRRRHDHARYAGTARRRPVEDVGVSNYRLERWQRAEVALGAPVLSNQVQFSLVARGPMGDLLPWAQRTGHLVIAWSPLGQGLLGSLQRGALAVGPDPGRQRPLPSGEPRRRRPAASRCARSARATASAPRRPPWPGSCTNPTSWAIPGASSVAQVGVTPPRPTWPSPTTSSPH
jgi:hypothetical protein